MVRIEVLTIVWSRAPRNMPIINPTRMVRIWAWVYSPVSLGLGGASGRLAEVGVLIESRVYRCPRQLLSFGRYDPDVRTNERVLGRVQRETRCRTGRA